MNNMTTGGVVACRPPLPIESIYALGVGMSLDLTYIAPFIIIAKVFTFGPNNDRIVSSAILLSFLFQRKRHQKGDESCASVIV